MLTERAGRLSARLGVNAKGTYFRTCVKPHRRWLDASVGMRFAVFKNGGVRGGGNPIALQSDALAHRGHAICQRVG